MLFAVCFLCFPDLFGFCILLCFVSAVFGVVNECFVGCYDMEFVVICDFAASVVCGFVLIFGVFFHLVICAFPTILVMFVCFWVVFSVVLVILALGFSAVLIVLTVPRCLW